MSVSLLLIATGKYKSFVQSLIDSIKQYFLINHNINVHLFTDEAGYWRGDDRVKIIQHYIPPYKFPEATLLRYEIFTSIPKEEYDEWMIYLDVDMAIVDYVGSEILSKIIAVCHPGYYNGGWGDEETTEKSEAYLPLQWRKRYYAGGFQGGERDLYYQIMETLNCGIDIDKKNGVMARWHDESFWNKYLALLGPLGILKPLSPSYCMPEAEWKRKQWGVSHFRPIILALEKEENIRE